MPINPSIAMGYQMPQLENPLNQYAKVAGIQNAQNQNALAQFQLATAEREQQSANALNEAYRNAFNPATGQIDKNKLISSLASGGAGRQIPGIQKQFAEQEESELKRGKAQADLIGEHMKLSRQGLEGVTTPEQYIAWHEANHRDPVLQKYFASRGMTADQARQNIMQKLSQPGGFEQLLNESKLGAEKAMEQHFTQQDTGGQILTIAIPKFGTGAARVVPGSQAKKVMSPEAAATRELATATRDAANVKDRRDTEMKLADDYRAQSKNFKEVADAYGQISKTLDKATTSPAATLAAATKFMKLLDPGSVVRESELGMALAASGVFDRATNYVNVLQSGKVLTKAQAADFKNITAQLYQAAQESQGQIDADFSAKAQQYGLRPEMVIQDLGQKKKAVQPTLSGQDKEAMDWANANPKDPRAAKIKERLGVQ